MPKVPEKCTRCGAPISWEEGASVVKCEFCGYKNNLKDDFLSLFKNYLRLYSRWAISGISDLYTYYYHSKYWNSNERDEISFIDWLIKKNILDKSHFDQIQGGYYLKYSPSIKPVILSNKVCGTSK